MKILTRTIFSVALTLALRSGLCAQEPCNQQAPSEDRFACERPEALSRRQVAAVILAVEDEIYDYSQEKAFLRAAAAKQAPAESITLTLYINPHLSADVDDGSGQVIYRNLPYGEIIRYFWILPDGLVWLDRNPSVGFPATQMSHYTEFMDREELREDKAKWLHAKFTIELRPDRERVVQAGKRQIKRVGFSNFLRRYTDRYIW